MLDEIQDGTVRRDSCVSAELKTVSAYDNNGQAFVSLDILRRIHRPIQVLSEYYGQLAQSKQGDVPNWLSFRPLTIPLALPHILKLKIIANYPDIDLEAQLMGTALVETFGEQTGKRTTPNRDQEAQHRLKTGVQHLLTTKHPIAYLTNTLHAQCLYKGAAVAMFPFCTVSEDIDIALVIAIVHSNNALTETR